MKRVTERFFYVLPKIIAVFWFLGLGLMFVAAISSIWGWYLIGWFSTLILLAFLFDKKLGYWKALKSREASIHRLMAAYAATLTAIAVVVNVVLIAIFLSR